MTRKGMLMFLSLTILVCSCSTVRLLSRDGLDFHLEANSSHTLIGSYKNSNEDTMDFRSALYNSFNSDTLYRQKDLIVKIVAVGKKSIKIEALDSNSVIDSLTIKGKYRNGYFKVKRQVRAEFIAGPLLWVLTENTKLIGLTKENKLVIISSGGSGYLLLFVFPIFAAGGGQREVEYDRHK